MAKTIYWAGDSTVKQNKFVSFPQTGIGQAFERFVRPGVYIENYAQNGRSSKSFIDEGRLDAIQRKIKAGDYLYIQFGHNDEKKQDVTRYTESFGSFQEYLGRYISVARDKEAFPVLITPLYRRKFNDDGRTLKTGSHLDYPDAMKELGARENVPVIDLCSLSFELMEQFGEEATRSWFMHVEPGVYPYCPDGKKDDTHLQYEGAFRFAQIIAEELRKLGSPYSDILMNADDDYEDPSLLID
jgi:lysophospholipase L1-like esterase